MTNNHDGVLIRKPWGYEWSAFDNGACAVWILHIASKRKTSLHCHPKKTTKLIVLQGVVEFTKITTDGYRLSRIVGALDVIDIAKGEYHQTEAVSDLEGYPSAEDGAWLMEIEEPSNKNDLVRMKDEYGREDKPYETEVVPYTGELLKLSSQMQQFCGNVIWIASPHAVYGSIGQVSADVNIQLGENSGMMLSIAKDPTTMKVSDYVADFIAGCGIKHVYGVAGGGCMHLLDSVGKHGGLQYVACHHEQAAAMAAEAHSRINGFGCALVTTGPGGTNAITGVACAWADSIPVLYISGQVTRDTSMYGTGLRQFGVQESNIVELVRSITKYAVTVTNEKSIRYVLEQAAFIAQDGRPGPVWVDIPLDIQSKQINPEAMTRYTKPFCLPPFALPDQIYQTLDMLRHAERPVIILGNGINLCDGEKEARKLVDLLRVPVITSWGALNILPTETAQHVGHMGIFGERAGNFAVQNADLLLVIGCRLSVPMIGYNFAAFAPNAKIVMVDIDQAEMDKPSLHVDVKIKCDAKEFLSRMNLAIGDDSQPHHNDKWRVRCVNWKHRYPIVLPEYGDNDGYVNSFHFIDVLSNHLDYDAIVVVDQGTAFTCTMQAFRAKLGQRFVVSGGHASMGYGLPGAIGACFASGKKPVTCIVGDGDLQMNLQELATIRHHRLPIKIFVLNNGGYGTIKAMQENHFKRYVGSESKDLFFPDVEHIANAYDITYATFETPESLKWIYRSESPEICEVFLEKDQTLIPRISSKKMPDGSIRSSALEDMFPFLPRDEFDANMKND